jgi:hypothetical protein
MYWDRHSLELTLELHPVMKPPAQEVAGSMWRHNLPPLMRFMELVRQVGGSGSVERNLVRTTLLSRGAQVLAAQYVFTWWARC